MQIVPSEYVDDVKIVRVAGREYQLRRTSLRLVVDGESAGSFTDAADATILVHDPCDQQSFMKRVAEAVSYAWRMELEEATKGASNTNDAGLAVPTGAARQANDEQ